MTKPKPPVPAVPKEESKDSKTGIPPKSKKILLNMQMKELCLEVSRAVRPCYSIDNDRTFQIGDTPITAQIPFPAVFMRNGKTNFNPIVVEDEDEEVVILESRAIKLSNKDIDNLIPYCLLSLFEPYVGKEMKMFYIII